MFTLTTMETVPLWETSFQFMLEIDTDVLEFDDGCSERHMITVWWVEAP